MTSAETKNSGSIKLSGLYALKIGMSTVFGENGEATAVTVLRYEPWSVTQLKTKEKDGYTGVQLACRPKKQKNSNKAEGGHLKSGGFAAGARWVRELRQDLPDGIAVGQTVGIDTLAKGDVVKVTARTKGRGFQGSVKRFNFQGGPAAHGSKFHRQPGSSGNRTWPGRVMPGKRFPGHYGDENVTIRNLQVIDVLPDENVILVKGAVPGAPNGLVRILKEG